MARVLLDVTNYLDWDQETLVFLSGQEEWLTAGLNVTYSVDTGFANVFGNPHLEFVGSREDLVELINRWAPGDDEGAVEERKIAIGDIEE